MNVLFILDVFYNGTCNKYNFGTFDNSKLSVFLIKSIFDILCQSTPEIHYTAQFTELSDTALK